MSDMETSYRSAGPGWILYSGIMLMLAGIKLFFDGLWGLDRSDTAVDALMYEADLGTWGWIWLLSGIVIFAAGVAVFNKAQWARWVGVIAASVGLVINLFSIYAYPVSALIGVVLTSLVIYGLVVYGEDEYFV